MDDLTQSQAESLKKLSTERLRSLLVKSGYDEDLVFATERPDLLTVMAECILKPEVADSSPDEAAVNRNRELYFREQEIRLGETELLYVSKRQHARFSSISSTRRSWNYDGLSYA